MVEETTAVSTILDSEDGIEDLANDKDVLINYTKLDKNAIMLLNDLGEIICSETKTAKITVIARRDKVIVWEDGKVLRQSSDGISWDDNGDIIDKDNDPFFQWGLMQDDKTGAYLLDKEGNIIKDTPVSGKKSKYKPRAKQLSQWYCVSDGDLIPIVIDVADIKPFNKDLRIAIKKIATSKRVPMYGVEVEIKTVKVVDGAMKWAELKVVSAEVNTNNQAVNMYGEMRKHLISFLENRQAKIEDKQNSAE